MAIRICLSTTIVLNILYKTQVNTMKSWYNCGPWNKIILYLWCIHTSSTLPSNQLLIRFYWFPWVVFFPQILVSSSVNFHWLNYFRFCSLILGQLCIENCVCLLGICFDFYLCQMYLDVFVYWSTILLQLFQKWINNQ